MITNSGKDGNDPLAGVVEPPQVTHRDHEYAFLPDTGGNGSGHCGDAGRDMFRQVGSPSARIAFTPPVANADVIGVSARPGCV